jgi:hypothetical protein
VESQESSEIEATQRHAGQRRGRLLFTVGVAFSMLVAATAVTAYAVTVDPDTYSFFDSADISGAVVDPDNLPVELGLRFTSRRAGTLNAVRFLKARGDRSTHTVNVWNDRGEKLASGTPERESRSGWQQVALAKPLRIEAGKEYVVSYFTSRYKVTQNYFAKGAAQAGPLATTGTGLYAYGGGFPTQTWEASNYWVDVVFAPQAGSPTSATVAPSSSPPAVPSSATATTGPAPSVPSSSAPPAESVKLDLPRVPWEGGPSFYSAFKEAKASGMTDPDYFPVAVWYESVLDDTDIAKDKSAGLNTYIELTESSDPGLVRRSGMRAITSGARKGHGNETVGWVVADEADMWGGAGDGKWTGKWPGQGEVCATKTPCGFDAMQQLTDGLPDRSRLLYSNYGKGVMFWQNDQDAAKFVNQYTSIVSADVYWYTDPYVCKAPAEGPGIGVKSSTCRRSANYGRTMDRLRALDGTDGKRQPVFAFVEVGHPFSEDDSLTTTGSQAAGAVMNSLIHEARGVIYFNHNFGGSCLSQHVLRDSCGAEARPAVAEVNKQIGSLAPVLNTQSYEWTFNAELDTMLKAHDGSYYVFAMPGRTGGTGEQKLVLPTGLSAEKAEVLFENRTVPVTGGAISDTFSKEFSYHVYKLTP